MHYFFAISFDSSLFHLRATANYGNCFIFNTKFLRPETVNTALPGPTYGLTLVLNIEQVAKIFSVCNASLNHRWKIICGMA